MELVLTRLIAFAIAEGEAETGLVSLIPPAVENAEVGNAVDGCLHAAGAAGFFPATRVIEPEVDSLNHFTGNLEAVVFDKQEVLGEFWIA